MPFGQFHRNIYEQLVKQLQCLEVIRHHVGVDADQVALRRPNSPQAGGAALTPIAQRIDQQGKSR